MIVAKMFALAGIRRGREEQLKYYFIASMVMVLSGIIYIMYSFHLFNSPITNTYHMYVALAIATVTFIEIGLNIRGIIRSRHNHTLLVYAIRMINLSASLIALVLTQTAILTFMYENVDPLMISDANGRLGILMGTVSVFLGIYMVFRGKRIQEGSES